MTQGFCTVAPSVHAHRRSSGTPGLQPRRLGPYQRGTAVYVDRPSALANIFQRDGISRPRSVIFYRAHIAGELSAHILRCARFSDAEIRAAFRWRRRALRYLPRLRGEDLRCSCAANSLWCHGDVLLDLANRRAGMTCDQVTLPGGARVIVCSSHKHQHCACGRPATLACDWKVPSRRSGTCDAPICASCTTSPAPDKDLCPDHAGAFEQWKVERA